MNFTYYDNKNVERTLNLKIGDSWSKIETGNDFLSSIFTKVDDGDGIVQEKEYLQLNTILSVADKIETIDNKLSDYELKGLLDKINNKDLNVEDINHNCVVQIDPNEYSPEQLKKRYPESKYKIENQYNNGFAVIDKETNKEILRINKDARGFYITDYDSNGNIVCYKNYDKQGTILFYYNYENGTENGHCPIVEFINSDVSAKNRFGFCTTGKDLEKHIKMLDKNNIIMLMDEYKKQYGEDIVDAIKGELGLDENIKNRVLNHIKECLEEHYGYKSGFVSENSQVSNKWHEGDSYSIVNKNDILTIKNSKTGKIKTIDLNKLTEDLDLRGQAAVKARITRLPGEILMDIAIECTNLKSENWLDKMQKGEAYYHPLTDNITLCNSNAYDISGPFVHELGHAVDFMGKFINSSTASEHNKFVETFKREREHFKEKTGKQYSMYSKDISGNLYFREGGNVGSNVSTYASYNEQECFAEIYTLLTTGTCESVDMLEDFFPETIKLAEQILNEIRSLPDDVRH